jgi:hypothetical protein
MTHHHTLKILFWEMSKWTMLQNLKGKLMAVYFRNPSKEISYNSTSYRFYLIWVGFRLEVWCSIKTLPSSWRRTWFWIAKGYIGIGLCWCLGSWFWVFAKILMFYSVWCTKQMLSKTKLGKVWKSLPKLSKWWLQLCWRKMLNLSACFKSFWASYVVLKCGWSKWFWSKKSS